METYSPLGGLQKYLIDPPPSLEGELMETPSETRTLNIRYSYPPPSLEGELMETFQPVRLVGLHKTAVKQV